MTRSDRIVLHRLSDHNGVYLLEFLEVRGKLVYFRLQLVAEVVLLQVMTFSLLQETETT